MNRKKNTYNSLLRRYFKYLRRRESLRAANKNERRQNILTKHIERIYEKLVSLKLSCQKGAILSTMAFGAMAMMPEAANAQSFGAMQTNPFNLTNVGGYGFSNPTLGDIDGDGDLDMISGQYYYDYNTYQGEGDFVYYENTGTNANPSFAAPQTNPFGLATIQQFNTIAPTLVDIDGDGDLDIMLNDRNGDFLYFENTGTATAPAFNAPVTNPFSLSFNAPTGNSQPTFADLDNDGDLDLVIGSDNSYSGLATLSYFENTGSATAPAFGAQQDNPFSLNPSGAGYTLYQPKLVDLDQDGDFDILAGVYNYDGDYNTPDGVFRYYENTGTVGAPVFAAEVQNPFGLTGPQYGFGLDVIDLDNDGDLDIIAGEDYYGGNFFVWEGCIPTTNTITTTEACQYTAPSGAVYSTSGTYTDIIPNATNCDSIITINLTIEPIADIPFTDDAITICNGASATLQLSSSQDNVEYYLRNDLNDTIVDGPILGDGNTVDFSTGNLTTSTTYNVYAEKPVPTTGLAFDGQNDYAEAAGINLANASFTIEFWAKRANTGNDDYIVAQGTTTSNDGLHIGYRGSNQITFAFFGNDLNTTNTFMSTDWQHIAVTYDNTTGDRAIYVDGVQEATDNSASAFTGTGNLRIGHTPWGGTFSGDAYEGNIDELRIWSTARSQTEIMDNMSECLTGTETGLISYYQFEDGTGTTATDETANGNDATLSGDTSWDEGSSVCSTCNMVMTQTATVTVNTSGNNTGTDVVASCSEFTWIDGITYTSDNNTAQYTLQNAAGCDSVVTLDLTILSPTTGTDIQTACNSYTWIDGNTYTSSNNTATDTLTNAAGCDSIVTLDLTINSDVTGTDVVTSCSDFTWIDGNTYTSSNNTATHTLTSAAGCDSIVTLDLTIGSNVNTGVTIVVNSTNDIVLIADQNNSQYQWLDCNNNLTEIAGANNQTYLATQNGSYAVEVTDNNGCSDTSTCETITAVGLNNNEFESSFTIYPNPTKDIVNIDFGQIETALKIKMLSSEGKELFVEDSNDSFISIDLSTYPKGVYLIQISDGKNQTYRRIVKQ